MIPEEEQSTFQRLVAGEEQARDMIDDLNDLEGVVPDDEDPEDVDHWEIAFSFTREDVPHLLEELAGLVDDEP
jgi:hypothetical protein